MKGIQLRDWQQEKEETESEERNSEYCQAGSPPKQRRGQTNTKAKNNYRYARSLVLPQGQRSHIMTSTVGAKELKEKT